MNIRDHVRSTLGETYRVLTEDGSYDATDKPDAVAAAISRALVKLTQPGTVEADLTSDFARAYIADMACHYLIVQAIDYTAQRMSQSDSIGSAPGTSNALLQSQTRQFYDRIAALEKLDGMLLSRLAADLPTFAQQIGDDAGSNQPSGARVSVPGPLLTEDPNRFPRITPWWLLGVGGSCPIPSLPTGSRLTPGIILDWLGEPC